MHTQQICFMFFHQLNERFPRCRLALSLSSFKVLFYGQSTECLTQRSRRPWKN